jgi:signal transduction histidine kinase
MVEESDEELSIPMRRYPSPVCAFTAVDETPVVKGVNEPFETAFGSVETGEPVADALDAIGLSPVDSNTVTRPLSAGESFTVHTDNERYRVETLPPTDHDCGYLLFRETTSEDQFGVENVASVVSHDLRNPLDVAKTRLRAGRELDDEDHFDHVARAHERMERIIRDVLTLARGEDVVDPDETVELRAVAREAWETVETGAATLDVDEPLPTTVADSDRVGRLFENLFRNAVEHGSTSPASQAQQDPVEHGSTGSQTQSDDAVEHGSTSPPSQAQQDRVEHGSAVDESVTDRGADSLSVTVGTLDDSSTEGFYVEDDGVGIPPAERDRVFEPGYSSDDHGTGLGLAIVARIADLHGWSYAVTDGSDGGARVEIRGVGTGPEP